VAFKSDYSDQVNLLLDVLPVINQFECFALKGGTAINLFIRNMPRLSVDIDLAYLPIESREVFLGNMTSELLKMKQLLESQNIVVKESTNKAQQLSKLFINRDGVVIKIEPNLVIRGSAFDCEEYDLCQKAQDQFLKFSRIKTLSFADIYGGKICAALDRYHPRDLFDIKLLFEMQGLTDKVRQAFIVYLASSPRPMHELLNPSPNLDLKGFERLFNNEFVGMTDDASVTHEELIDVRHHLIKEILNTLTAEERKFLLSLKSGTPEWPLMAVRGIERLPAILWKLDNIRKIPADKKQTSLDNLKNILKL
jgi:predicted nucleotidyltransferase component of viral defense system